MNVSSMLYQRVLEVHDITCSMSRRANCHDSAVMEAFFSSLKSQLADRFESCGEVKMELFDYIEVFLQPTPPAFDDRLPQPCCV
jgi:transposase InsO family protein